jgi:hypothetical protein
MITSFQILKFILEHALKGQKKEYRCRSLFLTLALDGMGGQLHASAALTPGERPSTHCTENWVWGAEDLAPTGSPSHDRPARSESLYRQRYPGTQ